VTNGTIVKQGAMLGIDIYRYTCHVRNPAMRFVLVQFSHASFRPMSLSVCEWLDISWLPPAPDEGGLVRLT
jgi:hypothetical protein